MLIKSTQGDTSFQSSLTNTIIGRVVARFTVDRYSLRYDRMDVSLTTATFEKAVKVFLSPFKAHNIAGGLYSTRCTGENVGGLYSTSA